MKTIETGFNGLLLIEPRVFEDPRGYFFESYNSRTYSAAGIGSVFVQDNQSRSSRGVIRGLHYQIAPHAQAKLVRVLSGRIFDVALDIRPGSPTFGKWYGAELSAENRRQVFVPRGFAHGFSVLSETAEVFYKCDSPYEPAAERGIRYDDPALAIGWMVPADTHIVSAKDLANPLFSEIAPEARV